MTTKEEKLKKLLTQQNFDAVCRNLPAIREQRKRQARTFAATENGIAVLTDFREKMSYIYAGTLGRLVGLEEAYVKLPSAFEEEIFRCIPPEELMERHVLELRFFQLQRTLPLHERPGYNTVCLLHFQAEGQGCTPILHRTYYLESLPNGSIWLSLCLYTPFVGLSAAPVRNIVDNRTGTTLLPETCAQLDSQLLSPRERSVLQLLAKGLSSKQIAHKLFISVNTVSRHRQNILQALQVNNTAAAVEIALRLHLIV